MGWPWSSSPADTTLSKPDPPLPEPSAINEKFEKPDSSPLPPSRPLTRDELAERELEALLSELRADVHPSSSKYNRVPKSPPPPPHHNLKKHSTEPSTENPSSELSLADSLLPVTMSCRAAFDAAFYCQSLGGQFNNLYQYGGMKNCSEHWGSFWLCMRSKSYSGEEKEKMIRDHYRKKAVKYRVGPSSEDVWESRDERLEWGAAFAESVDEDISLKKDNLEGNSK